MRPTDYRRGGCQGRSGYGARTLEASDEFSCRLAFYGSETRQPEHSHALPVISLILTGSVHEEVCGRQEAAHSGALSVKPADVRHSDAYGDDGALILSISIADPELWARAVPDQRWRWARLECAEYSEIVSLLGGVGRSDAVFELLALAAGRERRTGIPPNWLRRVFERLADDPNADLTALASDAGVHPVYLSRAFRRWYAVSPSEFRLRRRSSRATQGLLGGTEPTCQIAHECGFSDQSHMTRSIRKITGLPPRRLIHLFANDTGSHVR